MQQQELDVLVNNYSNEEQRIIIGTLLTHIFGTKPEITISVVYGSLKPHIEQVKQLSDNTILNKSTRILTDN